MTDPQDPFAPPPEGAAPQPPANPYDAPPPPYGQPAPYGAPPAYGAPPVYGQPAPFGQPAPYGTPVAQNRNGLGVTSLVLGIASVFCFGILVIPAVLAIAFGFIGRARAKRQEATNGGLALAGIITGFIGLVFGIGFWVFVIANASALSDFTDCQDQAQGNTVAEQACNDQLEHDLFGTRSGR